ncbi:uncharacterized protein AMSG_04928 [Thecamonas trahens ATCC 50062]|uniref:Tyrosine-protein kinase ephrin type A/B receptor-like domain-containing protein n=1 Tax=Thecamonas trahens ATCC 50062 TaxID=461836 RepID=A0A0L0D8A9_THETB|nr:hypothetical protein AMSG_04928 [Thecamonas trahens ATCC 50062]KNC48480.1 hypothetical protein AMSG_04928 [Thecamonas trahens ATCC 50062]|eukprot:XP_013758592.1 hypothetical protein AMSG_04928 [Thecamonas trahens ATCC 50062]
MVNIMGGARCGHALATVVVAVMVVVMVMEHVSASPCINGINMYDLTGAPRVVYLVEVPNYPASVNCTQQFLLDAVDEWKFFWELINLGTGDTINILDGAQIDPPDDLVSYVEPVTTIFNGQTQYPSGSVFSVNLLSDGTNTGAYALGLERWREPTNLVIEGYGPSRGALFAEQVIANLSMPVFRKFAIGTDSNDGLYKDIIVFGQSTFVPPLQESFLFAPAPMVFMGGLVASHVRIAGPTSGTSYGAYAPGSSIYVHIVDPDHPLAAGLSGTVQLVTDDSVAVEWVNPHAENAGLTPEVVAVVAESSGSTIRSERAVAFMFEKGTQMPTGLTATSRRVFVTSDRNRELLAHENAFRLQRAAVMVAARTLVFSNQPPALLSTAGSFDLVLNLTNTRDGALLATESETVIELTVVDSAALVSFSGGPPQATLANGVATFTNLGLAVSSQPTAALSIRAKCLEPMPCYWAHSIPLEVFLPGRGPISPQNSYVSGLDAIAPGMTTISFTIHAVDVFGVAKSTGGDVVEVSLQVGSGSTPLLAVDNSDGTYAASFSAGEGGAVTIVVRVGHANIPLANSPFTAQVYANCPPGEFAKTEFGPCEPCLLDVYRSANDDQAACVPCPVGSGTSFARVALIANCTCKVGFYNLVGVGLPCARCPVGAVCDGGTEAPYAAPGYFPASAELFLECKADRSLCPGGRGVQCAAGHRGRLCADCHSGWYRIRNKCHQCEGGLTMLFVLVLLISIVVLGGLAVFNARSTNVVKYTTLSIAFNSLQISALFGQFEIDWPSLADSLFAAMSFANFNLELAAPECAFEAKSPYLLKYLLTMLLPLYFVAVYAFVYACFVLPQRWFATRFGDAFVAQFPGFCTPPAGSPEEWPVLAGLRYGMAQVFFDPINKRNARHVFIRCWWQLLSLAYLPLALISLGYMDCTRGADGVLALDSDPSYACSGRYWHYFPFALVFSLAYAIGIPAAIGYLLRYKRRKMERGKYLVRYGFLTARYLDQYYWWEVKIMARKFGVVIAMLFVTSFPSMQGFVAACVLMFALADHHSSYPYITLIHNLLETFSIASAILVLGFGVVFHHPDSPSSSAGGIIAAIIFINLAVLLAAFVYDLAVQRREKRELDEAMDDALVESEMVDEGESGTFAGEGANGKGPIASVSSVELTDIGSSPQMQMVSFNDSATSIPPVTPYDSNMATIQYGSTPSSMHQSYGESSPSIAVPPVNPVLASSEPVPPPRPVRPSRAGVPVGSMHPPKP